MKLSERLEAAVERLYEDGMDTRDIADLFRECAELARRVEGAPVRMVGEAISYGVSAAGTGISNGQRVRLVPTSPTPPDPGHE